MFYIININHKYHFESLTRRRWGRSRPSLTFLRSDQKHEGVCIELGVTLRTIKMTDEEKQTPLAEEDKATPPADEAKEPEATSKDKDLVIKGDAINKGCGLCCSYCKFRESAAKL